MNKKNLIKLGAVALIVILSLLGFFPKDDGQAPATEPTESISLSATTETTLPAEEIPTQEATEAPTQAPTTAPTEAPTTAPTEAPTQPTEKPTQPTEKPTQPTEKPTEAPTTAPTEDTDPAGDPAPGSALTISDAIALGASKQHDTYTSGKYYVTGVITEVYNTKYGNMKITDSEGHVLTVYGTYNATGSKRYDAMSTKPVAGDTVTVYGILGQYKGTAQMKNGWITGHTPAPVQPTDPADPSLNQNGSYTTKEEVALYIHTYGKLPPNFITKSQAQKLGWKGGSLEPYAPGKCIGGDRFGNYEGLLPTAPGRYYTECDIDTLGKSSRGAKRIVFSNDGLVYYTDDHYESFTLLYGEE